MVLDRPASESTRDPDASSPGHAAGKLPVFIHAQDYDQIQQAVALCARHDVPCVIVGGRDAPLCADLLKRHNVPVIVDGTFKFPKRDDQPYDDAFTLPARLHAAGIKFCIASGEETAHGVVEGAAMHLLGFGEGAVDVEDEGLQRHREPPRRGLEDGTHTQAASRRAADCAASRIARMLAA